MFLNKKKIHLEGSDVPKLIVVIDTEEEFDWAADPDSSEIAVNSMQHIHRVQEIFNEYGVVPCYVVDYPIASQPLGYEPLLKYVEEEQCEIGAHLHPWVNPPIAETVNRANMYPGNLPEALEKEKLAVLKQTILNNFNIEPIAYKAGRYGFGPNTAKTLRKLGFKVDLSVCPPLDSRADGGPDYRRYSADPYWFGEKGAEILEIPCTGAFVGWAHSIAVPLFEIAQKLKAFKAPGILSRICAVDRLMLSPEGFNTEEHIKLTRFLYNCGVRTFTWSFHSPSVVPGNTSYVKDSKELEEFLASFHRFFEFFFEELKGEATTPARLHSFLEAKA